MIRAGPTLRADQRAITQMKKTGALWDAGL
jgi:hypothetical protein